MLKKYFKKVRFQKKKNIIIFALGSRLDMHKKIEWSVQPDYRKYTMFKAMFKWNYDDASLKIQFMSIITYESNNLSLFLYFLNPLKGDSPEID